MSQAVLAKETTRRHLQQIIYGLSEGVILAEVDQSILWANEAALRMHGVKNVKDLGANTQAYAERFALRYRNNHAVMAQNYPLARVAKGDEFTDVVVEVTPTDNDEKTWVHRIRSLVLNDSAGEPELLALVLTDATEWASAEERFEKTFAANPAPAVICRLSDLRFIKVNAGFLEMTGYGREHVIGRSVYELDVLERAENRDLAVQRLSAGATIPQMSAELRLPDGGSKLVIVAGQPLDMNEEACMLFSFIDLESRRKAETALRHSEERFAKSFRLTPVPTLLCNADSRLVVDINEAFMTLTGHTSEELIGKSIEDIDVIDQAEAGTQLFTRLEKAGHLDNVDLKIRKKGNEVVDCVLSADSVNIDEVPCYLLVLMNITERKRSELELVAAIEEVMQDASWFSQKLIEKLANAKSINSADVPNVAFTDLTGRERDVLGLICEGLADKEIASRLKLAPNTVRNHVATVYSKLGVHSRSAAIVWARERGLFSR
ncbi:PAS domain S-box protein [Pseudomonas sp. SDO528_S397]